MHSSPREQASTDVLNMLKGHYLIKYNNDIIDSCRYHLSYSFCNIALKTSRIFSLVYGLVVKFNKGDIRAELKNYLEN